MSEYKPVPVDTCRQIAERTCRQIAERFETIVVILSDDEFEEVAAAKGVGGHKAREEAIEELIHNRLFGGV